MAHFQILHHDYLCDLDDIMFLLQKKYNVLIADLNLAHAQFMVVG